MRRTQYLLGGGLFCLALGAGLFPLVMLGLLGILLVGVGIGLLLAGGVMARSAGVSKPRAAAGLAVFVAGVVALLWAAADIGEIVYTDARGRAFGRWEPVPAYRLAVLGLAPAAGAVLALGLRIRGAWDWARCAAWGFAAALVVFAAAAVFYTLAVPSLLDA